MINFSFKYIFSCPWIFTTYGNQTKPKILSTPPCLQYISTCTWISTTSGQLSTLPCISFPVHGANKISKTYRFLYILEPTVKTSQILYKFLSREQRTLEIAFYMYVFYHVLYLFTLHSAFRNK